jgi:hypothetical protein
MRLLGQTYIRLVVPSAGVPNRREYPFSSKSLKYRLGDGLSNNYGDDQRRGTTHVLLLNAYVADSQLL